MWPTIRWRHGSGDYSETSRKSAHCAAPVGWRGGRICSLCLAERQMESESSNASWTNCQRLGTGVRILTTPLFTPCRFEVRFYPRDANLDNRNVVHTIPFGREILYLNVCGDRLIVYGSPVLSFSCSPFATFSRYSVFLCDNRRDSDTGCNFGGAGTRRRDVFTSIA